MKYVLRAPWKGGAEDCEKAIQYLVWENESGQGWLSIQSYFKAHKAICEVLDWFADVSGDDLWLDISDAQTDFLQALDDYLCRQGSIEACLSAVRELLETLRMRDQFATLYTGMDGQPQRGKA